MSLTYDRFDLNICDFLGETVFVVFDFPTFKDHSKYLKKFKDIFYDNFKLYQYFYDIEEHNITLKNRFLVIASFFFVLIEFLCNKICEQT